jgi:AAA15 family ATPase/GTPase
LPRSEIRHSQIENLLEKVRTKNYYRYLNKLTLSKVRGFSDKVVTFDFPVTAIVGPNGGGKTTILGAAGCAYKSVKPRLFFAKSGNLDDSMLDWRMEYELIDRQIRSSDTIKRTVSFRSLKWNREALDRDVKVFGVSRTVPATERIELRRFATNDFVVDLEQIYSLEVPVKAAVEKILGKSIDGYSLIKFDSRGKVTLLKGQTDDGTINYSEFHFGAGESSVIRMVMGIESSPDYSLILIEEIENGLHPLATVRMVEYLIDIAERKKIQSIFTTHSNDALLPLPDDAIWAAIGNRVSKGKLNINSLRAITGQIDARLAIFTEDVFSMEWVAAMLRNYGNVAVDLVEIHALGGDGTAVSLNESHNRDPTTRFKSACFIDGDSQQATSNETLVYRLPGDCAPEKYVFDKVMEKIDTAGGKLTVALHQPFSDTHKVVALINDTHRLNRDIHTLYSAIGEKLGFLPEPIVQGAFLATWCHCYPEEVRSTLSPIDNRLPMINRQ